MKKTIQYQPLKKLNTGIFLLSLGFALLPLFGIGLLFIIPGFFMIRKWQEQYKKSKIAVISDTNKLMPPPLTILSKQVEANKFTVNNTKKLEIDKTLTITSKKEKNLNSNKINNIINSPRGDQENLEKKQKQKNLEKKLLTLVEKKYPNSKFLYTIKSRFSKKTIEGTTVFFDNHKAVIKDEDKKLFAEYCSLMSDEKYLDYLKRKSHESELNEHKKRRSNEEYITNKFGKNARTFV